MDEKKLITIMVCTAIICLTIIIMTAIVTGHTAFFTGDK